MNNQLKAQTAELAAMYEYSKKGYTISRPILPASYDFIAEKDGRCLRVQVKTIRKRQRHGREYIVIDCRSSSGPYQKDQVDVIAGYDPEDGRIYVFSVDGRSERWVSLDSLYRCA